MDENTCELKSSYGSDPFGPLDPFQCNIGIGNAVSRGVSSVKSQLLVLDGEKGELVQAPVRAVKKNMSEAKAKLALKNHSEAERRRRQRINGHLATLRELVPSTDKMDKATLLAEVVNEVKELKKTTLETIKGLVVPMDSEELTVEPCSDIYENATSLYRASLCCRYRPDIFVDLKQAVHSLGTMKLVKVEISTLEDWLKIVFLFSSMTYESGESRGILLLNSIYKSLSSVLNKASVSMDYSPRAASSRKRRKVPPFESSSSSS